MNNKELVWGSKNFQVLGIEFDIDLEQMVKANYNKKIMSIDNVNRKGRSEIAISARHSFRGL